MKNLILACLALVLTLSSCKKEEEEKEDKEAPTLTINSPVEGSAFANNSTVTIQGNVADNDDLHELLIQVLQGTNVVYQSTPSVHDLKSYDFNVSSSALTTGSYTVKVTVADHNDNSTFQTRTITIN
jgi:hypothetical protein